MWLSIHQNKKVNILSEIQLLIGGFLFALSSFLVLINQLKISWSLEEAFTGGLLSGLVHSWNRIADTLGSSNYILLERVSGEGNSAGLFLSLTLIVMIAIAYFLLRSKAPITLVIFLLPEIILGLVFNLHASALLVLFNIGAMILALMLTRFNGGLIQGIVITGAILALTFGIYSLSGLKDFGERITFYPGKESAESIKDSIYGSNNLGSGDLSLREREIENGLALKVAMSEPQPIYLKGFIGSIFDGNKWQPLSDAVYYENEELMNALEEKAFNIPGQLTQAAGLCFDEVEENRISISVEDADKRFVYIPYELTEKESLKDLLSKGGDIIYPGKFKGLKNYNYTATESQTDNWTDSAGRFFTMALGREGSKEKREDIEKYLIYESYYNTFVYDNYTFVPIFTRELLASTIGMEGDLSKGHLDYKMAINAVRSYLEDNFIYTENLGVKQDEKKDEISEFVSSGKGYDIHYASLATLIFRYYGIPARYVEGYLITPEDVKSSKANEEMEISKANIHAWTEIYIDGIGFVPLEVTPEYYGVMPEADMSIGISNQALIRDFIESYGNDNQGKTGEEGSQGGGASEVSQGGNDALQFLWWVLIAVLSIVGILLLIFLIRWLARAFAGEVARRKLFKDPSPKVAVAAIYGYMEEYGLNPDVEAIYLGNKAAYSKAEITEEERSLMSRKYKELMKGKEKKLSLMMRKVKLT